MDGWVILGTKLDTKQLEKDLKEAERQLQQFEKEQQKLLNEKNKIEIDISDYEKQETEFDKLRAKASEYRQELKNLEATRKGMVKENPELAVSVPTGEYARLLQEIEEVSQTQKSLNQQIKQQSPQIDKAKAKYVQQQTELEEINQKIQENAKNQGLVSTRIAETNAKLQNTKGIDNMSQGINGISDQTKNLIRQVGRWALAVFSVRSAYLFVRQASSTLAQYDKQYAANLEYIRYVLAQMIAPILYTVVNLAYKLLSYINMIANAWFGVNLFANASTKAFEKANKSLGGSVKKAKELNKQLTGFDEMNVLQDNGDVSSGGGGGGFTMPDFDLASLQGEIPSWLQWIIDNKDILIGALLGIAGALIVFKLGLVGGKEAVGLGLIVAGIAMLIEDLVELITDPSWEKFGDVLIDIGIILAGLALVMLNWPLAVAAAVALIVGLVIKYWDEIVAVLSKVGTWIYDNVIKPVADFFKGLWEGIKLGAKLLWDFHVEIFKKVCSWIYNNVIKPIADFFKGLWDGIVNGVTKAVRKVKDIFNTVKTFFTNIITTIVNLFKKIGTKVGDAISKAFKAVINTVLKAIENILNSPIRAINGLVGVINKVPGVNLGYLPTFSLPRLAVGGIVNMPGRGVPIGGAIAGEVSKEGVIPLTNSQAMQELGETIGRYITINANITNSMNGRVISRKMQKIMANQDFAYNT